MKKRLMRVVLLLICCLLMMGAVFYPNDAESITLPEAGLELMVPDGWTFWTLESSEPQPDIWSDTTLEFDDSYCLYASYDESTDYVILLSTDPIDEADRLDDWSDEELDMLVETYLADESIVRAEWQEYAGVPFVSYEQFVYEDGNLGDLYEDEGYIFQLIES